MTVQNVLQTLRIVDVFNIRDYTEKSDYIII